MNQPGDSPIYVVRGAPPRPVPGGRSTRPSWRGPLIVVAIMFGWMVFTFALAAIAAPNDPNVEAPTPVGLGVVVTPADGWYDAGDDWEVGPDAIALQKSGVYLAFWASSYGGTNESLLDEQLGYLKEDFDSIRVLPASSTTVAGDVVALATLVTGVSEYWSPENELVVAVSRGVGVVMLATAPSGQLARVQGDIDAMLDDMVMPR
ncbi:MAG: hypothetical protein GX630_03530 [Actinobacteria bacterium]|nr:hypothetical protein [Actinomycetota bacterium]